MRSDSLTHLSGLGLIVRIAMAELPVVVLPPGVELSVGRDGGTVPAATGNLSHMLALQVLNHLWPVVTPTRTKTKRSTRLYIHVGGSTSKDGTKQDLERQGDPTRQR